MSDDKLDFLEEKEQPEAEVAEPQEVAETPQEAEPEPQPPETVEAQPVETTGETDAPPVSDSKALDGRLTAMLDEREKRQTAERRAEQAERQLQAMREQQAKAQKAPDFFEDPDKRLAHERQIWDQNAYNNKLSQSRFFAERDPDYGKEAVDAAMAYFDQHPAESHRLGLAEHPSPFHAAVDAHRKLTFDPDTWREQEREKIRQEVLAEAVATPPATVSSPPKAPPSSLATAPGERVGNPSPGTAFDGMFPE